MSSIDLIILGIIKKSPMSPYDINQLIEVNRINSWVKISTPALYQNVKKLAVKGYLSYVAVKKGEMPEKKIYSITHKGDEYFFKLMQKYSSDPAIVHAEYNTVILHLDLVDKKTGQELLKNLRGHFLAIKEILSPFKDSIDNYPFSGRAIIKQHSMLIHYLLEWIDEIIREHAAQ
ncbi:MAG: PadR family transcriptional regulator [Chrysiogenales bacterium]|nr:MAG: PadR family transcriptional regulator [Chrysiogenales bacterium]